MFPHLQRMTLMIFVLCASVFVVARLGVWAAPFDPVLPDLPADVASVIYVDGALGSDSPTCGAATGSQACQTIAYALQHRATAGSIVSVAAGTYNERITLRAGVRVQGAGASVTTLNGGGAGPVVTADDAAIGSSAVLSGFTVTGGQAVSGAGVTIRNGAAPLIEQNVFQGNAADYGGAFHLDSSAATIRNNTIQNNTGVYNAGGIYVWQGAPSISGNTIQNNTSDWGGGLFVNNSAASISGNTIRDNLATSGGGGIQVLGLATCSITGNTVEGNSASPTQPMGGGGLNIDVAASPVLSTNVIRANTGLAGGGINLGGTGSGTLTAHGNVICGNGGYQFYNETTYTPDLIGNWWGTNSPGATQLYGPATYTPAIAMTITANPATVLAPGATTLTATLQGGGYRVPDGTTLSWSTTLGTLNPTSSTTTNGSAQSHLSSAATGTASVSATDPCGFTVTATVNFVVGRAYLPLLAR